MKLCYLVLLALASTCVRAQTPFQLFRPGVQYLYENPEYEDPSYQIASQFYGMRVASLGCTEVYQTLGAGDAGQPSICVYKKPSPFGSSICQTADSTVMHFADDNPFVLYQTAGVGERWVAQRSGVRLTAEVLSIDSADVLGLPDLVKTIAVSANDTSAIGVEIRISRQYGILEGSNFFEFPFEDRALELAGMSAPAVGVQLPDAAAYGLAVVGDTFQIEQSNYGVPPFGGDQRFESRFTTFTILEVDTSDSESYIYTARGDIYETGGLTAGPYRPVALDTTFTFSTARLPRRLAVAQPGEAVPAYPDDDSVSLSLAKLFLNEAGLVSLRLSTPVNFREDSICGFDMAGLDSQPGGIYTVGVPVTLEDISGQSGPQSSKLRYYSSGGFRYGTFHDSAQIMTGVHEFDHTFNAQFQVFPNPTSSQLNVVLPGTASYQVRLYNLAGSQVQSLWMRGGSRESLATDALAAGSYFLVVFEGGRAVARRKFIVK